VRSTVSVQRVRTVHPDDDSREDAVGVDVEDAVAPGFTVTPMTASFFENETFVQAATRRLPLGRLLEADEIAGVIVFLAARWQVPSPAWCCPSTAAGPPASRHYPGSPATSADVPGGASLASTTLTPRDLPARVFTDALGTGSVAIGDERDLEPGGVGIAIPPWLERYDETSSRCRLNDFALKAAELVKQRGEPLPTEESATFDGDLAVVGWDLFDLDAGFVHERMMVAVCVRRQCSL
jgi:Enoyl-(Acyl carrier protein) reductase